MLFPRKRGFKSLYYENNYEDKNLDNNNINAGDEIMHNIE